MILVAPPALHNVYDFNNESVSLQFLFFILPLTIGPLLFFTARLPPDKGSQYELMSYVESRRILGMIIGAIITLVGLFGITFLGYHSFSTFNFFKRLCKNHHYAIVEGCVTDYHPIEKDIYREQEHFKVKDVYFTYNDYIRNDLGYTRSASHGGVIRPGLYVKIAYYNDGDRNVILKLDTEQND